MTTTVIGKDFNATYGQMSTQTIAKLIAMQTTMIRLHDAIATASSGYAGTPGTEFETGTLFGVMPSATPGEEGTAYRFAMDSLFTQWQTFWAAAEPFIAQLDNGSGAT